MHESNEFLFELENHHRSSYNYIYAPAFSKRRSKEKFDRMIHTVHLSSQHVEPSNTYNE